MSATPRRSGSPVSENRLALPAHLAKDGPDRGPRFDDPVWDLRAFVPCTARCSRIDFSTLDDPVAALTAREYLFSRLHRAIPGRGHTAGRARPLKVTAAAHEFTTFKTVLRSLQAAGASRLAEVTEEHLDRALASWQSSESAATYVAFLRHLAAHGPYLSVDRLTVHPWPGRTAEAVAGLVRDRGENRTERIPEQISSPLIKAAVFYVETASADLVVAMREVDAFERQQAGRSPAQIGEVRPAIKAFIRRRRAEGRGIPALPSHSRATRPDADVVEGVVQAPNNNMIALFCGLADGTSVRAHNELVRAAAAELGYEAGGLDTEMSFWPDTGLPWRPRLDTYELWREIYHLRTACWIVIAYLSGMRDDEVRELGRDCAFTEFVDGGRVRYKLRGRVFKHRAVSGDAAEWVVLKVVHDAVDVLLQVNNDPTHLFGYQRGRKYGYALPSVMPRRLAKFRDHVNELFSIGRTPFIPDYVPSTNQEEVPKDISKGDKERQPSAGVPWAFDTRQFRRTLAWHIAHQPFGVIAGAKQYKHAKLAMFDGYAGTSASGFAAEVAAEEAVALLDYAEELYRDWNDGGRAGGGGTQRIDAEFSRIRRELGDLPGTVANPARLRSMLHHLTKTLHPGVLNDCFHQAPTAVCAKRARPAGRPLPLLNACAVCPNARQTTVHLPRIMSARDRALHLLDPATSGPRPMPPLQRAALEDHVTTLNQMITEVTGEELPA